DHYAIPTCLRLPRPQAGAIMAFGSCPDWTLRQWRRRALLWSNCRDDIHVWGHARPRHKGSMMHADFTSQVYFRNPGAEIEKLRSAGAVVEVHFPFVGKVWTTTTQDLADRVLKDAETFTIRNNIGGVAGLQWWMPRIVRTLANHMLSKDEPDH